MTVRPLPSSLARFGLAGVAAMVVLIAVILLLRTPLSDRDWAADHAVQPRIAFDGSTVQVDSLRDFRHGPDGTLTPAYRSERFDLDGVRGVWFALAPFSNRWDALAHTFVSFELDGGRFLAVSVEARRERDEPYSLLGGLTRRFEVTYVVGTEQDLLGMRALRGDTLYLYPSRATPQQAGAMLSDMLRRAEALRAEPEFYNTLLNNCATNLREHVNRVATEPLPFGWAILLPGYSDELALGRGLLATDLPLAEARRRYRVDELVRAAIAEGSEDFSARIRGRRAALNQVAR
jgi:hypothetical protein